MSSDTPRPNELDRRLWEEYQLTPHGACLPPYDEAGEELQRLWHGMLRLTHEDIHEACQGVLKRIDDASSAPEPEQKGD